MRPFVTVQLFRALPVILDLAINNPEEALRFGIQTKPSH